MHKDKKTVQLPSVLLIQLKQKALDEGTTITALTAQAVQQLLASEGRQ